MVLNQQQQQQRWTGYLFAVLTIILIGSSIFAFSQGSVGQAAFHLPVIGFLGYLAWRQLQPGIARKKVTADERTRQIVQQATAQAFWILIIVMLFQNAFQFVPEGLVTSVYMLVGMGVLGLFWGYYRWRGPT